MAQITNNKILHNNSLKEEEDDNQLAINWLPLSGNGIQSFIFPSPLQNHLHGLILLYWHLNLGIELKNEKYFIRPEAAGAAGAATKPVTEDDLQNLKDADIEDIGSHR